MVFDLSLIKVRMLHDVATCSIKKDLRNDSILQDDESCSEKIK